MTAPKLTWNTHQSNDVAYQNLGEIKINFIIEIKTLDLIQISYSVGRSVSS